MDVSSIAASNALSQLDWRSRMQQRRQDVGDLANALQSGDVAGAQKAFGDLQSLAPAAAPGSVSQTSAQAPNQTIANPIASDMAALEKALQSGDISSARSAFSQLQQDMQTAKSAHHHHHRHASAQSDTTNTTQKSALQELVAALGTNPTTGTQSPALSTLLPSPSSGDSSNGQSAFADLLNLLDQGAGNGSSPANGGLNTTG